MLVMTGANSAVGCARCRCATCSSDEVDGYPLDVEGEGDAIRWPRRARAPLPGRFSSSSRRRRFRGQRHRAGSTRPATCRYFVPARNHPQWLRFEQLRWDKGNRDRGLHLRNPATRDSEHHKTWMLEHGEWRAPARARRRAFHLSSLYSPVGWRSWRAHRRGVGSRPESGIGRGDQDLQEHRTGRNLGRGRRSARLATAGRAPRGLPIGSVPGGLLLVGAPTYRRIASRPRSGPSGRGKESWLVEHRVLMGDTAGTRCGSPACRLMLAANWTHASVAMPWRFALDTGFATRRPYAFVPPAAIRA